jgi:uncharacterized protein (TIGR02466 family)
MKQTIYNLFPSTVFYIEDILDDIENKKIVDRSLEIYKDTKKGGQQWNCNMYNTIDTFNLINDPQFNKIIKTVNKHVQEYASFMNSNYQYSCKSAWVNVGLNGTYQEYHHHSRSTISCVYYADTPEGSGNLIFENPVMDMIPVESINEYKIENAETHYFVPKQKSLIIFRSYLRHMVMMGTNKEPRISIALNF